MQTGNLALSTSKIRVFQFECALHGLRPLEDSREIQTVGKQGESDHFLQILEIVEILEIVRSEDPFCNCPCSDLLFLAFGERKENHQKRKELSLLPNPFHPWEGRETPFRKDRNSLKSALAAPIITLAFFCFKKKNYNVDTSTLTLLLVLPGNLLSLHIFVWPSRTCVIDHTYTYTFSGRKEVEHLHLHFLNLGCAHQGGHATTRFLEGFLEGSLTVRAS